VLKAGTWASLLSTAVILAASRRDSGQTSGGTNATSQWLFGEDRALAQNSFSWRHTASGYVIHHAMSVFWACLHQGLRTSVGSRPAVSLSAAAITALAAFVDLRLMPPRFTPGFEKRVSGRSLIAIYAAYACGLIIASDEVRDEVRGRGRLSHPRRHDPRVCPAEACSGTSGRRTPANAATASPPSCFEQADGPDTALFRAGREAQSRSAEIRRG
jgi:hypothetical protein